MSDVAVVPAAVDAPAPMVVAPTAPSAATSPRCRPATPGRRKVDVVVIGTGAGGAIAGTTLALAGRQVLFLEAGGAYSQKDFRKRSLSWSTSHLFADRGTQSSIGPPTMVVTTGRVVGGSTVLNSGICFRPPDKRLLEWQQRTGSPHLAPAALAPFVDEVWRRIGVMTTHAGIGRQNNLLLEKGLNALGGVEHAWMDRNAPGCVGCGVCYLGCPSGGKASVDRAILPEAMNAGAEILTHARAERVVVEGGVAKGVVASVIDERTEEPVGELVIDANLVIVSGNAFGSPLLLLKSGLGGPEVGKHLSLHPGFPVFGEFKDPVVMWDGVPQGYYAHDPHNEDALIESVTLGPAELFALFGRAGPGGLDVARRFAHLSLAGAMIRDEGGGTVSVGPGGRLSLDARLTAKDLEAMKAGGRTLVRAWFAAGATAVCPMLTPLTFHKTEAAALAAIDAWSDMGQLPQPYASHPHGTCRIGPKDGEHRGVVDDGGRVHGTQGLYVMDGSVFPSTLGVNPQVTIMALTLSMTRRLLAST